MAYDELIATITLVGSLLSCIATTCVLVSYVIYRDQQRSFRHALVLNLALAEFINSLNNSISGIIFVRTHDLTPGPACTFNGWIGQLSVQAADFSILAIALVTVLTITRKTYMPNAALGKKVLICLSVWVVPVITSTTATSLHQMVPVSGNWCWISSKRTDLRYALGHGWRFAIIFTTIGVYIYVWWYMRQHFATMASTKGKGSYDLGPNSNSTGATGTTGTSSSSRGLGKKKKGFEVMYDEELELDDMQRRRVVNFPADVTNFPGRPTEFPGREQRTEYTFGARNDSVTKASGAHVEEEEIAPHEEADVRNSGSIFEDDDLHLPMQGPRVPKATSSPPPKHSDPILVSPVPVQPTSPLNTTTTTTHHHHPDLLSPTAGAPALATSTTTLHPILFNHDLNNNPNRISLSSVSDAARRQSRQVEREIKRMLLLNAYPIMYIILWTPGLVNRLLEATGSKSQTLAVLQSSSQYVGFANALTYGFNEHLRERIRGDLFGRLRRGGDRGGGGESWR